MRRDHERKEKIENRKEVRARWARGWLPCFLFSIFYFLPCALRAQEAVQEVVANLAGGRVVVYVAKDGIAIAANEHHIEAESRPPAFVPLPGKRLAVLLGAVEWLLPGTGRAPVRLDAELPRLLRQVISAPRLQQEQAGDLENIGLALLEPLRVSAGKITRKLALGAEEPIVEMLIVGYAEEYGPEVWLLRYRLAQDVMRGDYYQTRVLRPTYTQLYPPEKGQPRTLLEVRYPPDDPGPDLLALLTESDPRLTPIRTSNVQAVRAIDKLNRGECNKGLLDDAVIFLRSSLDAVAQPGAAQVVAIIKERTGLEWILAPPEPLQKAEDTKPREPGAPTLRKKP